MENFLSSFQEKTSIQKALIVVGITTLLLVFITLMLIISTPKQKKLETVPATTSVKTGAGSGKQLSDLPSSNPTPSVSYEYSGKGYKIIYPTGWRLEKITTSNSESVRFIPESNPKGIYIPSLRIKVVDYDPDVFAKMESDQASAFPKNNSTFESITAEKFTGVLTSSSGKSTYNTSYFLINNNLIYLIEYFYDGVSFNPSIESKIQDLLNSFQFN